MANTERLQNFAKELDKKFDPTRKYLQQVSDEELAQMYEEADSQTATDRSGNGVPKGLIWEELDRRSKRINVLPGTDEMRYTPSRDEDDDNGQQLSKKIG